MEPIKLEDLIPCASSFTLRKTGKTYRLRPFNLGDEAWLKETFGSEIAVIFNDHMNRIKDLIRIIYHQIEEDDKEDFLAQDVTIVNEVGERMSKRMGGYEVLYVMISGWGERLEIIKALAETIGASRPLQDKILSDQKKSLNLSPSTGPKSSTSSQQSMDGRQNISSRERLEKSGSVSKRSRSGKSSK